MIDYIKSYLGLSKKDWEDAPKDKLGLTRFKVANDLHIGSEYQDNPKALKELEMLNNDGYTVLNGDIFDLACCKKRDVLKIRNMAIATYLHFKEHYTFGNHERMGCEFEPLIKTVREWRVGFTHGDLISDYEKWYKYRRKPHGSSKFKLILTSVLDDLDHLKAMRPLPKGFLDRAANYCNKYNLDVLVCGHFHPEAERRYKVGNKLIVILPAHKINELWL